VRDTGKEITQRKRFWPEDLAIALTLLGGEVVVC
jgi:hypothetical protein